MRVQVPPLAPLSNARKLLQSLGCQARVAILENVYAPEPGVLLTPRDSVDKPLRCTACKLSSSLLTVSIMASVAGSGLTTSQAVGHIVLSYYNPAPIDARHQKGRLTWDFHLDRSISFQGCCLVLRSAFEPTPVRDCVPEFNQFYPKACNFR